jgi:hypothetical protein
MEQGEFYMQGLFSTYFKFSTDQLFSNAWPQSEQKYEPGLTGVPQKGQ